MKVICEKCSASYDIENQRIPAEGMTMKCPKCLGSFHVQRQDQPVAPPDTPPADDTTKYFIRRHTGSVFGPFAQAAILTMATDGKLDGSEDLSPDKVDWTRIAEHAAFQQIFSDSADADLPTPAENQPAKLGGVPKAKPGPVGSTMMGMPGISPPGGEPAADPSGPKKAPRPVSKPAITPPPPVMPDLPGPREASSSGRPAITPPPPPDVADLPTPKASGEADKPKVPRPAITPPAPPDVADLPTPKAGAGSAGGGMPDLPTPKKASGPAAGMPDLPTPKKASGPAAVAPPDLPTPKGTPEAGTAGGLPDLPTPKGAPEAGAADAPPDLPTPKGAAEADGGMSYGEVDLLAPAGEPFAGEAGSPLDLSELDLVAPKDAPLAGGPDGAPDLSELDLVAPKDAPQDRKPTPATVVDSTSDMADLREADSDEAAARKDLRRRASRPAAPAGARLLGMPRGVAIGVIVGVVVLAGAAAAYKFIPRGTGGGAKGGPAQNTNTNKAPVEPRPVGKVRVAYAPAMDLDTHQGYLNADRTYLKQHKKTPSSSLKAARAKARLADAYRYGVRGRRLKKARSLLTGADANDVETRKAKALSHLLGGKLKKARSQLKKARKLAKKDAEVHLFRGWVELAAGNRTAAEKAFRRALKYRGESAAALWGLVQCLSAAGDDALFAERDKALARVLKLSPRHVEARVAQLLGAPPTEVNSGIKTLADLQRTLEDKAAPAEKAALAAGLGRLHQRGGQLDRALDLLARAAKDAPKDASILAAHGEALLEAGDGESAATTLKAALAHAPTDARYLEALVRAHLMRGQALAAQDAIIEFEDRGPQKGVKPKKRIKKKKSKKRRKKRRGKKGKDGTKGGASKAAGSDPYLSLAHGRVALATGKRKAAKDHFLQSTTDRPRFTPGHAAYLQLMLDSGQFEGMKSVLELIKRKYPDGLPATLRAMEGRMLLGLDKPAQAEKAFQAALVSDPQNNQILLYLALCLWKHRKKPEEAYLILQRIYKRAKSLTRVITLLADYHWNAGETERAFSRFKNALKVNRSLEMRRRYAELLLRVPNPVRLNRAEKLLAPILKDNIRDHAATALYALVELGKGLPKRAMKTISRAISRSPETVSYKVIKARIAEESRDTKQALKIYDELLKKNPKDRRISLLRARLLCKSRVTKLCIKAAKALLKRFGDPEGHVLLGLAHLQKRKTGRAMRAFRKAVAQKKDYALAHFLLGRTLYHDESYRKALARLIRCLELADESARWHPDVHYFLGMSYHKIKNARLATKHLKKYLATPGNPDNLETGEQQRTAKAILK